MKLCILLVVLLGICASGYPSDFVAAQDVSYHYGFIKSKQGKLPSIDDEGFKETVMKHGAVFLGDTTKKEIFLTFNNGYENGNTVKVLDVLKDKKVPAAFFVTGYYVKYQPEILKRIVNEGHIIGNHSWNHPDMSQISNSRIKEELDKLKDQVASITGQKEMPFMRPPSGTFNDRMLRVSKELGYTNVFWSITYKDWDPNENRGWQFAYHHVMSQLHPGAVIMLHAVSNDNAAALDRIIEGARKQGYVFKSLDQLTVRNY